MTQAVIQSTTQKFLEIYDITNDIVILKDGSTALIMTVNALNFGLLAESEQDAIIYSYAGLLNSINYPIQIVIRSQTKDVTSYLNLLEEEEQKATEEIKRGWIKRYRAFVAELIKERNVLDKKFYVVIPASALEMGLIPPSTVLPGVKQPDLSTVERSVILEKAKEILDPKRDHLLGQLGRIGLVGRQLTTQEIIQLFYLSYNPEAAEGQQITDTSSYTTPLVQASVQGGFMTMPGSSMPPISTMPSTAPPTLTPVVTPVDTTVPVPPTIDGTTQNEINSTLQELNPNPAPVTPVPTPSAATTSSVQPLMSPPAAAPPMTSPITPSMTSPGTPPPAPPVMPPLTTSAAPTPSATPSAATTPSTPSVALPPLPEI